MGDPSAPTTQESMDSIMKAVTANLPSYAKAYSGAIMPTEQAQQDASKAISPQQNQLQLDMLKQFGPQMNKVGTDIEGQNQNARAANDAATLKGAGADVVNQTQALDKSLNPEFYNVRSKTADATNNLLGSFDTSGGLSGGERTEVQRSLNKSNLGRGIQGAPTGTAAVENAMTFGNAGFARKQAQQAGLGSAIGQASGFLPASKSSIDPLQTGLGRPSQSNAAMPLFQGASQTGGSAMGLTQGLAGMANQQQTNASNINANKRNWMDMTNQAIGSL